MGRNRRSALVVPLLLLISLSPARAVKPEAAAIRDVQRFKALFAPSPVKRLPKRAARLAFHQYNKKYAGKWAIKYNPRNGAVSSLRGSKTRPYPGAPEQAARAFLAEAQPFLGIDPSRLTLSMDKTRMGLHHLWFDQKYQGIPVENGRVAIHLTAKGEVIQVDSNFEPDAGISVTPTVDEPSALRAVAADIGAPSAAGGGLVLLPTNEGAKLAWKFRTTAHAPLGRWDYYVDAHTGQILLRFNEYEFLSGGTITGKVWDVDPKFAALVTHPFENEFVFAGNPLVNSTSDVNGNFTAPANTRIISLLRGTQVTISNSRFANAMYTDAAGNSGWFLDATARGSSPHPYPPGCPSGPVGSSGACPVLQISAVEPGCTNCLTAMVAPVFSNFVVGLTGTEVRTEGGATVDDEVSVLTPTGSVVGNFMGDNGNSVGGTFTGSMVPLNTYQVSLFSTDSGQSFNGFDIAESSYFVLDATQGNLPSESFTWISSYPVLNASLQQICVSPNTSDASCDEINMYYHLNLMHDFFEGLSFDNQHNTPVLDSFTVPYAVANSHYGPNLQNAFFNPTTGQLYFGDVDAAQNDLTFSGDATVIHHEYTHLAVNGIHPIWNTGQPGAMSEGGADYFSGASFPGDGMPGLAAYLNYELTPFQTPYPTPVRTMNPIKPANGDCSVVNQTVQLEHRVFPGDWCGEIHLDGEIISQALWLLRPTVSSTMTPTQQFEIGFDTSTNPPIPKSNRLFFESLFFYPDSFEGLLGTMLSVDQLMYGGVDAVNIQGAFADHGISTGPAPGGDALEPNDGAVTATDLATHNPVQATIYPAGDQDFYALTAAPGSLTATLNLPAAPNSVFVALRMTLLDSNLNVLVDADPPYDVNGSGGGFCQLQEQCQTSASQVVLNFSISNPGVYYLVVEGGQSDFNSTSVTASQTPYTLSVQYPQAGSISGSIVTASYDNDLFNFNVQVSSYLQNLYSFDYAQLRDHDLNVLPQTSTNLGLFLTTATISNAPGLISGTLQLVPGFNARFPAVGTVELEVYGINRTSGSVVSLGVSPPLQLTTQQNDFEGWNNIFNPNKGGKATFRWDLLQGGHVTIGVYTVRGQLVKTVLDAYLPPGKGAIDWLGDNLAGDRVASGVYLVRLSSPNFIKVTKAVVVK